MLLHEIRSTDIRGEDVDLGDERAIQSPPQYYIRLIVLALVKKTAVLRREMKVTVLKLFPLCKGDCPTCYMYVPCYLILPHIQQSIPFLPLCSVHRHLLSPGSVCMCVLVCTDSNRASNKLRILHLAMKTLGFHGGTAFRTPCSL